MGELSVFIEGLLFILILRQLVEFSKNANSATAVGSYTHIVVFVWRQSEFAFFGAVTPVAALFYFIEKEVKVMKKACAILGFGFGILFILVGFLAMVGAFTPNFGDPSIASPQYDSGYAQFGTDYYTYSVNNSAEAASAARVAAYNIEKTATQFLMFAGMLTMLFGAIVCSAFGIVIAHCVEQDAANNCTYRLANNINNTNNNFSVTHNENEQNFMPKSTKKTNNRPAEKNDVQNPQKIKKSTHLDTESNYIYVECTCCKSTLYFDAEMEVLDSYECPYCNEKIYIDKMDNL